MLVGLAALVGPAPFLFDKLKQCRISGPALIDANGIDISDSLGKACQADGGIVAVGLVAAVALVLLAVAVWPRRVDHADSDGQHQ